MFCWIEKDRKLDLSCKRYEICVLGVFVLNALRFFVVNDDELCDKKH